MKALNLIPKAKKIWAASVTCGPIKDGPPIDGCGSKFEVGFTDLFMKESRIPNGTLQSFHWRCPQCGATNYIDYRTLPGVSEIVPQKVYLEKLRASTIMEIAKLHSLVERPSLVEAIGTELLLDDNLIQKIVEDPTLYS